jgi:hypothetical protein
MPGADALSEMQELAGSGLFDGEYYLTTYPDVAAAKLEPFSHYCNFGWREGRRPNPYFDSSWYLQQYPDVVSATMNPLLHYVRHGDREGRRPIPVFEPAWYRAAYGVPSQHLALAHFLTHRREGLVLPSPAFYIVRHAERFAAAIAAGEDPFVGLASQIAADAIAHAEREMVASSGLLDPNYYLINGGDVLDADIDPVAHFCGWGWRERRNPNIYFDVSWYLATNQDVDRLGINPIAHYILEGESAGRRPVVYFDPLWYRAKYGVPSGESALGHYLKRRREQAYSPNPLFDAVWYFERHREEIGPGRDVFAHYLHAGMSRDIQPSPEFDAVSYRRTHLGRPSRLFPHAMIPDRHNPLAHYLLSLYS